MKTDIKTLLEFAGVDTTKGKAKQLVEAVKLPDLSKKSDAELEKMMNAAEKALKKAPQDSTQESDAEDLASHIERTIFKRSNP